jgi:hypothetical protein
MAFPEQVKAQILQRLRERWASNACPLCGTQKWSVEGFITFAVENAIVRLPLSQGPVLPCAALVCLNCGNTLLINLSVLGFVNIAGGSITGT